MRARLRPWLLLAVAVVAEVTGSISLRAAVDAAGWYALVVPAYLAAFAFLGGALRAGMPLGVAYGMWGAVGVALTALLGAVLFAERLTPVTVAGLVLVVVGVLLVELGSQRARRAPDHRHEGPVAA